MVKKILLFAAVLSGCLLVGCAEYWYQDGKTFRECHQARNDCFKELQKRTDFVGSGDYEFEFMTQCMNEKGYQLVKESELPLNAKREHPETSLHWRAKGVAGSLNE